MLYEAMIVIAPAATGEPGKAPASYAIQTSAATILPSLVAPSLQRIFEPEVGPVARRTSARVMTSFTGRPLFFDNMIAGGSGEAVSLPPKPPPISAGTTLILPSGIWRTCAVSERIAKGPW